MTAKIGPGDLSRDEVLESFAAAHPSPNAQDVRDWSNRYPDHADEIFALAIDLNRYPALLSADEGPEPTQKQIDAAWERHKAAAILIDGKVRSAPRLQMIAEAAGTDLADLAAEIDIDRRILVGLESGRILLPVSGRLISAIAATLKADEDVVAASLNASFLTPRVAFAKARGAPQMTRGRYEDAVRTSGMSNERKAFWLGED
jgi:transcriptional regulator with XRE-family HTH domain